MENVAEKLYNILGTKFDNTDIKTLDSTGKETTDMEEIKMFSFEFIVSPRNYGPVVILLSANDDLEVYYGDNTSKLLDTDAKKKWENLIEHLSTYARSNRLGFSLKHTSDLKYDLSNIADITECYNNLFEGYYGTRKTSYNKQGKAKIIIKHSRALGEDEKRFRNISSLFVENADGERFKLPFTKLAGARAMARHVTEGGTPYDLFGLHISEMVKDINTLGGFVRRSKMFEDDEDTKDLVETGRSHYTSLRKGLKQIAGKRGYNTYQESWEPSSITIQETDTAAIRSKFTERSVNSRVEDALPLLARLQQMAENSGSVDSREDDWTNKLRGSDMTGSKEVKSNKFPGDTHPDSDFDDEDDDNDPHQYNIPEDVSAEEYANSKVWEATAEEEEWRMAMGHDGDDPDEMIGQPDDEDDEMDETVEFEKWANRIVEGTWSVPETPEQIEALKVFLSQEQPLGIDAMNVTDALSDIIGDDDLYDDLGEVAEKEPDADARPIVIKWIHNAIKNLDFVNPAIPNNLKIAIQGVREGLNKDLDADNDQQLNASVNKDLDKYTKNEEQQMSTKPFTEYVAEVEDAEVEVVEEVEEVIEADEEELDEAKKEWKKPWEDDDDDEDAADDGDKEPSNADLDAIDDELDEDKKEPVSETNSPYVTLSDDSDLKGLMQRTNFLLRK